MSGVSAFRQALIEEQFALPPPRTASPPQLTALEEIDELQAYRNRQVLLEALEPNDGDDAEDSEAS